MSTPATEDRRYLAREAASELQDIFDVIRAVEPEQWRAVRGLCLRAESLLWVVASSSGLETDWSTAEQDYATVYGSRGPAREAAE